MFRGRLSARLDGAYTAVPNMRLGVVVLVVLERAGAFDAAPPSRFARRALAATPDGAWLASLSPHGDPLLSVPEQNSRDVLAATNLRNASLDDGPTFANAAQVTLRKFLTMQKKRVVVSIKAGGALSPSYIAAAEKLIKHWHPDVVLRKDLSRIVSDEDRDQDSPNGGGGTFEIWVDGKLAYAKNREKRGVFLQMRTLSLAIQKARRRRRPGQVIYGDEEMSRLEVGGER